MNLTNVSGGNSQLRRETDRKVPQRARVSPRVFIEQVSRRTADVSGRWLVTWRIENLGQQPLLILAARLPHDRLRSEERELVPAVRLSVGESAHVELPVECREPPGTVVENAFIILRALSLEEPWRVFARLRVAFDDEGGPQSTTEVVTAHPTTTSA